LGEIGGREEGGKEGRGVGLGDRKKKVPPFPLGDVEKLRKGEKRKTSQGDIG